MDQRHRNADLMAILIAVLYPSLLTFVYFIALADFPSGVQQATYGIGKAVQFCFPIVWVMFVMHERPSLPRPDAKGLWWGLVFGVTVVASMFVLYTVWLKPSGAFGAASGQIREKVAGFGVASLPAYSALGTFYAVVHSLLEEYYWRWFVFGRLRQRLTFAQSALLSSFGFMLHHVILLGFYFGWTSPLTYLFSLGVAIGGLFWAWLYDRNKSLYAPWLSHLLVDAGIFLVGYDVVKPLL